MAIKRIRFLESEDQEVERQRFLSEARGAGRLSHPNIVQLHDVAVDEETGEGVLTMELVAGSTLRDLLAQRAPLSLIETGHWLGQVAAALDYAHGRGLVHRDIKPGNVLIDPGGNGKLSDFGIATIQGTVHGETSTFVGTPSYMAPEQITGGEVDARADVFALGVMAYEMLTGSKPFRGENLTEIGHRILHSEPPPPRREDGEEIPKSVITVLRRALAKDRDERFGSAGDFHAAYRQALLAPQDPGVDRWRWIGLSAVALVAVGAAFWVLSRGEEDSGVRIERPLTWRQEVASDDRIQRVPAPPESSDRLSRLLEDGRTALNRGDLRSAAVAAAAVLLADAGNPAGLALQRDVESGLGGTPARRSVRLPAAEAAAPADGEAPRSAPAGEVRVRLVSEVRRGLVMIYAGERQILKREFRLEKRPAAGSATRQSLEGSIQAPAGELKVYVVRPGQPAKSVDLEFAPVEGEMNTLEIRIPRRGLPQARLAADAGQAP